MIAEKCDVRKMKNEKMEITEMCTIINIAYPNNGTSDKCDVR